MEGKVGKRLRRPRARRSDAAGAEEPAFHKASKALHSWAGQLERFQDEADRLERKAGTALDADEQAKAKDKDRSETSNQVGKVEGEVEDLEHRYRKAADAIGADFDSASGLAPDEPGFFESLADDIADTWNATIDWIQEHADDIAMLGDLLSDITGILGMLAILTMPFEPLGAIFGAAALITSGLALVSHSVAKAAGADVEWKSIGLDAVGLMPGIGLFSKGVKVVSKVTATARGVKKTEFGADFVATELSPGVRNIFATGELAGKTQGGLGLFGKRVVLGGKFDSIGLISHESGALSRLAGMSEAGYHQGQLLGTKGINLIPKVNINPTRLPGMLMDAGIKIAPKFGSIPDHLHEATSSG